MSKQLLNIQIKQLTGNDFVMTTNTKQLRWIHYDCKINIKTDHSQSNCNMNNSNNLSKLPTSRTIKHAFIKWDYVIDKMSFC